MPAGKRTTKKDAGPQARALWTGAIAFGLVNVPIRLYPAVREHTLHFHYVHAEDSSPIGYQKVCKVEQKPVPDDEIVKAFEVEEGRYVFMTDEDFERSEAEQTRSIEISDFVPVDEIDPIFFAKTYYAGPAEGAEHVYALLTKALEESGLVAVGKLVLRDRQRLVALRVRKGAITVEQLHFADEIVEPRGIRPRAQHVGKDELTLARRLIESATSDWKPSRYRDTYRDELWSAIQAKRKARQTHDAAEVETEEEQEQAAPPDLLEALRASLEHRTSRRRRTRAQSGGRPRRQAGRAP
jgi:DNA end-binding protein Ku